MQEIVFVIEQDPDGGYNAQALGHSIFTEGETEAEIKQNIIDAMKCHFNGDKEIPKIVRLHFVRDELLTYA